MDADVAEALRALAKRVRHNVPTGHNPERFHIEKSEIEGALSRLAKRLDGGGRARRTAPATDHHPHERQRPADHGAAAPHAVFRGGL